jgi:hypothetical protein
LWCVEYDIIEEDYIQEVESRGINASREGLQVFADPFEPKTGENREDSAFQKRWASAFQIGARLRGSELKGKSVKVGQYGRQVTITSGEMYPE